jgi:hypothetical protein
LTQIFLPVAKPQAEQAVRRKTANVRNRLRVVGFRHLRELLIQLLQRDGIGIGFKGRGHA